MFSSSSVPTMTWSSKYDVFLSFRGKDTRYTFVDHLYATLVQRGICVFKDDEELKQGKMISPELLKAIEESRFAVVVLSKNYAESSWCLVELAKIMEFHKYHKVQKVIPVFYHVDPTDVRTQKNDVAVFFQQHEGRLREEMDKVDKWREALTAIANLSGLHICETFKQGESTYINKIVHEILGDMHTRCDTEKSLVGINSDMDKLNSYLRLEENKEVRMVGIHGMGGIGKTTIAKALFRRIAYMFDGSSFVHDVRENSSTKRHLCGLQEKVLREVLHLTNYNFNVQDPEDGASMIRARFENKKVLIVLDDVDNWKQLEFLAAKHDSFGPGSRVIITTRNEQLLYDTNYKHKVSCLLDEEALELFSKHAFKTNHPPKGYEEWSCRAIHWAGNLPLALRVFGSYFHGRKAFTWENAFHRLANAPNVEIFETLKISFDGLEAIEREMFLDIACFFKGKNIGYVNHVLESCDFDPLIGISVLIDRSLITISNDIIGMHDLIQEMGWQIVRENFSNSRLWRLDDIHNSLKSDRKLKAIEAIVISDKQYEVDEYEEMGFNANIFERMKNLRLLDIRGKFTCSEPKFFPEDLRWLRWSEYPFSCLSTSYMSKLIGLEVLGGAINQFWNGQKIMRNLKLLRLQKLDNLTMFPDVSLAPNIEKLVLSLCTNLVEVHESLGCHKRIFQLDITRCERLKHLPSKFEMESLRYLKLTKCSSLKRFPEVSPCMVNVSFINIDFCSSLKILPSSFGYMSRLGKFSFRKYTSQPYSMKLHTMTNWCPLRTLYLSYRPLESEAFLRNLHLFSTLETLNLSGNDNLIQLPPPISCLFHLRKLYLNDCHRLQVLHALPSTLQELKANNCYALEKIDGLLKEYDWWYHISFMNCQKLLKDEVNEIYFDQMLQQSFFQKIAVADRELRIGIPGNKIPRWFEVEQPGYRKTLMIPPRCDTQIIGILICGVIHGEWQGSQYGPNISVQFKKDGQYISRKEIDCIDVGDVVNGNTWISYKPFSSFDGVQHEDWSGLVISISKKKAVRCATRLVYKEDLKWMQQITTCITYPQCIQQHMIYDLLVDWTKQVVSDPSPKTGKFRE